MLNHLAALLLASLGAWVAPTALPTTAEVAVVGSAARLEGIDWFRGELFAIRAKAQAEGKGVLFVVHSADSSWCKKLFQTTLRDPDVIAELADLVCVQVDLSRDEDGAVIDTTSDQIASRFPVRSFPTVLYLGPSLAPDDLMEGFVASAPFLAELRRMKSGVGTLTDLRAKREAAPDDIDAIWNLAAKCYDLGYVSEHAQLMARVGELDPEGRSKPVRTVALQILEEQLFREYTATGTYDHETLVAFLEDEPNPSVAYQGWSTLAGLARSLRDSATEKKQARAFGKLSRDAYQRAWTVVPVAQKPAFIAQAVIDQYLDRDELKGKDRRFVAELAEALDDALDAALAGQAMAKSIEAYFCDARACAAFVGGDDAAALRWIDRAIELDPTSASFSARRAELRAGRD